MQFCQFPELILMPYEAVPISGGAQIPPVSGGELQPLTVEQCRNMLGWEHKSDAEIEEFLAAMREWIDQFYDSYFTKKD